MLLSKNKRLFRLIQFSVALILGAGLVILTVSAIDKKEEKVITDISIHYNKSDKNRYITEGEILSILKNLSDSNLVNSTVASIDLSALEKGLNKNSWIAKAQLFIDNRGVLNVDVVQNKPIARVFIEDGKSFYLGDNLSRLPIINKKIEGLPVFTGFRGNIAAPKPEDSLFLHQMHDLAAYISESPFWSSQIEQIDIAGKNLFEMVPRLGDQVIRFGDGTDIDGKFDKLELFYKQVASKIGWNKYEEIDLRFDHQIVATRRDAAKIVADSLATMRNMARAVKEARRQEKIENIQMSVKDNNDSAGIKNSSERDINVPEKKVEVEQQKATEATPPIQKPKAVMNKRN